MTTLDLAALVGFLAVVVFVSLRASRVEKDGDDYFLAGRSLPWWLIGFSLIASNISTEHFVGMTGSAASAGLAVASYEWLAAPALVFVAWWLLPHFLRAGITTIPQFLEQRYDRTTRTLLAVLMAVFFVFTVLASVLYSGAQFLGGALELPAWFASTFDLEPQVAESVSFTVGVWGIGLIASIYTVLGGLKAVVWSDLIQGSALLLGGALVTWLALERVGDGGGVLAGWNAFASANADRLHVVRAWDDPDVPSLSLVTGLWIPVMFYWGLNQFITQRTLAAGSLAQGQLGIFFAAAIKLFLPFIVVIPGMLAVQILGDAATANGNDGAYPALMRELVPTGVFGLLLAAVVGSIMSTFNSGLNSAATVVTLDLVANHRRGGLEPQQAVLVGRWVTAVLAVVACLWAPLIRGWDGVFAYIQELWGFVSAPTCAIFFAGLVWRRTPPGAAKMALVAGPLLYLASRAPSWIWTAEEAEALGGAVEFLFSYASMSFLYHMFVLFVVLVAAMWTWMRVAPLAEPRELLDHAQVPLEPHPHARLLGSGVLVGTAVLYAIFW
jgi:solute:Na+ symporter, SSS family